jgi:hypothetical protein
MTWTGSRRRSCTTSPCAKRCAHVDGITDSGRGEIAELLRPFYLDYLRRRADEAASRRDLRA